MAKLKNHTARNVSYKAHRNGIKRAPRQRYHSLKQVCPKFRRIRRKNLPNLLRLRKIQIEEARQRRIAKRNAENMEISTEKPSSDPKATKPETPKDPKKVESKPKK